MDAQLRAINATADTCFESTEELLSAIKRLTIGTSAYYDDEISDNAVINIKAARKQDFDTSKSTANKLSSFVYEMFGNDIDFCNEYMKDKYDYKKSWEEIITMDIRNELSTHDPLWIIDFVKHVITSIKLRITTSKFVNGRLVTKECSLRNMKKQIIDIWDLNDDTFSKQLLKLFEEIFVWENNYINTPEVMIIESSLKEELLSMSKEELDNIFTWSDNDLIEYHILHFNSPSCALPIIHSVRELLENGKTPSEANLNVEDNWTVSVSSLLDNPIVGDDWDDELESTYNNIMQDEYNADKNKRHNETRIAKNDKISISLQKTKLQPISIRNKNTGDIFEFESKENCRNYLQVSSATFSKFLHGVAKINKEYEVVKKITPTLYY